MGTNDNSRPGAKAAPAETDQVLRDRAEQKILRWLKADAEDIESLKHGGWMSTLSPYLTLHSFDASPTLPRVTFAYTVQASHCNRLKNLHGGCAATLFDSCTTIPVYLLSKPGFWLSCGVSRALNVTYLRPAALGEECLVECEIIQIGMRLAALRGTLRRKRDGEVLMFCNHEKVNIDKPTAQI